MRSEKLSCAPSSAPCNKRPLPPRAHCFIWEAFHSSFHILDFLESPLHECLFFFKTPSYNVVAFEPLREMTLDRKVEWAFQVIEIDPLLVFIFLFDPPKIVRRVFWTQIFEKSIVVLCQLMCNEDCAVVKLEAAIPTQPAVFPKFMAIDEATKQRYNDPCEG